MKGRIYALSLISLLAFSCKKEQDPLPGVSNPCDSSTVVSADFNIGEVLMSSNANSPYKVLTDTVFKNSMLEFNAVEGDAIYTWETQGQVYNTQDFNVNLLGSLAGNYVGVSLIVEKEPNLYCFPNDNGKDTLYRNFYVSDLPSATPDGDTLLLGTNGVYRVYHPGINDSIEIEVIYRDKGNLLNDFVQIKNFDGNGAMSLDSTKAIESAVFRRLEFASGGVQVFTESISGYISNPLNGDAHLHFRSEYLPSGSTNLQVQEWDWYGRKIN